MKVFDEGFLSGPSGSSTSKIIVMSSSSSLSLLKFHPVLLFSSTTIAPEQNLVAIKQTFAHELVGHRRVVHLYSRQSNHKSEKINPRSSGSSISQLVGGGPTPMSLGPTQVAELHPLQRASQHLLSHQQPSRPRHIQYPPFPGAHFQSSRICVHSHSPRLPHSPELPVVFVALSFLARCFTILLLRSSFLRPRLGSTGPEAVLGVGSGFVFCPLIFASSPLENCEVRFFRAPILAFPSSSPPSHSIILCLQALQCEVSVRPSM